MSTNRRPATPDRKCERCGRRGRRGFVATVNLATDAEYWTCANQSACYKRANPRVDETDEYIAFTRRILTAMARRLNSDPALVADLAKLAADVDAAMVAAVAGARSQGYSWADIAALLGTTRQAAQQRFGHRIEGGAA